MPVVIITKVSHFMGQVAQAQGESLFITLYIIIWKQLWDS